MVCYLSDNFKDEIEDLLFKKYGEHPITYADSYMDDKGFKPAETVLTHKDDLCSNQSLDYIFRLYPKRLLSTKGVRDLEDNQPSQKQSNLRIPEGSARVEKFFIDGCDFTQLSDHYGTMVTLEYGPPLDKEITMNKSAEASKYDTFLQQHILQQSYDPIIVLD